MSIYIFFLIFVFLLGMYVYCIHGFNQEGFEPNTNCPNILIQKDAKFYLYNSKLAKVPGVNPVEFDNLEDYTEYLDWQHSQGIRCPVLYLQQTYDAQGNQVYKARPSVSEPQGGLPPASTLRAPNPTLLVDATRDDKPYNKNSFPAYDSTSYYVGTTTPLDVNPLISSQNTLPVSPDPMDANWGGNAYTQSLIDQGYYKGNEVKINVP